MQFIDIKSLKPHGRNEDFFDDITGDNWREFLNSVKSSGVIEPIVITQDKVIVSGHQRARASKELQFNEVPCRIKIFEEDERWSKEDWIIKELIETNLRQRGIGNTNPVKLARCIRELERLYGVQKGGDRKSNQNNLGLKTQSELASELGMTTEQIRNYKHLLELHPEIQLLVENGEMKATVAHKVWAKLPQKEQEQFLNVLGVKKAGEMSQKESIQEIERLKEELATERSKPAKVIEKEVVVEKPVFKEVLPEKDKRRMKELESIASRSESTENELKQMKKREEKYKQDLEEKQRKVNDYLVSLKDLKSQLDKFKETAKYDDLSNEAALFVDRQVEISSSCNTLAEKIAVMSLDVPADLPDFVRYDYIKSFSKLKEVCDNAVNNLSEGVAVRSNNNIVEGEIING